MEKAHIPETKGESFGKTEESFAATYGKSRII
jgi:hypothetical protein